MNINKKRLTVIVAGLGAVGAVTALGLGGTSALYTSQADPVQHNIESGTVVLTKDVPHSFALDLHGFMPGDSSPTGKYAIAYSGNDAFVGLNLMITSTAQKACSHYSTGAGSITPSDLLTNCTETGTVPMFDGDHLSGSLDMSILPENGNTAHQIFLPAALEPGTQCSAAVGGLVTCTVAKDNVIVPHGYIAGAPGDLVWTDGNTDVITVKASLPLGASNIFQGSTVAINLTAHAVQKANNAATWLSTTGAGTTLADGVSTTPAVLFPLSWS